MWYKIIGNQSIQLTIFVKVNAKKSAILKVTEDALHISLHAKPVEGEANKELIRFLSDVCDVPKSSIVLLSGEKGRHKRVQLPFHEMIITKLIK